MIVAPHTVRSRNGDNLEVLLRRPDAGKLFPTVLFVQGIGMDMHEWKNSHDEIAEYLVNAGFLTVQFDFSYQRRVTHGMDFEIGLVKRSKELEDVFTWTVENPHVNSNQIGIYAMSFGVSTVLCANINGLDVPYLPRRNGISFLSNTKSQAVGRQEGARVKSLCLIGGIGFRPEKYIKRFLDRGDHIHRQGETRLTRSSGKTMIVQKDFWPSLESLRQEDLVKKLSVPVFVIHGERDSYVATDDMKQVYNRIGSNYKKLKIYKDVGHGFSEASKPMRNEFLREIVKWFKMSL